MNITVEKIPSHEIGYIRRIGPYGADNVQMMDKLKNWARENNLLNDDTMIFGIAWDNPAITNADDCRYDTCIAIPKGYNINDNNINYGKIIGGEYAVVKIAHTAHDIKKAWKEIFGELLKQNVQCDETRPIIERYIAEMVKNNYCEICVPIK